MCLRRKYEGMAPSLDEVADWMHRAEDPVVTAREVSEALDCSRRHALDQLKLLEREGSVGSKQTGGRSRAWWHEERVCPPHVPPEEHPDQSDLSDAGAPTPPQGPRDGPQEDVIEAVDLPGSGERLQERRNALRHAVDLLREQGETRASDLREQVYSEHSGGYASPRSLWKNCLQTALRDLDERGELVVLVDGHDGVWRARGDR